MGLERKRQFRKRKALDDEEENDGEDPGDVRSALEEVKLLQQQRERRKGMVTEALANPAAPTSAAKAEPGAVVAEEGREELVLQDTFAQETAVHVEDPNMLKYIEQEMAKKKGISVEDVDGNGQDEDELYKVPDHLKVKRAVLDEGLTTWTTGIAEVQLPIEYKVKNIEETEAAKKSLQERRPFVGRGRPQTTLPASYSADYFQRGREYAEKLRREHPESFRDNAGGAGRGGGRGGPMGHAGGDMQGDGGAGGNRRQAATDEIMLERFRKRERNRLLRR